MFIQGVELWVAFQKKIEDFYNEYYYVIETDITAYFNHINHDLMVSRISDIFGNDFSRTEITSKNVGKVEYWLFMKF
jgi:retron-type reverse transcriptase